MEAPAFYKHGPKRPAPKGKMPSPQIKRKKTSTVPPKKTVRLVKKKAASTICVEKGVGPVSTWKQQYVHELSSLRKRLGAIEAQLEHSNGPAPAPPVECEGCATLRATLDSVMERLTALETHPPEKRRGPFDTTVYRGPPAYSLSPLSTFISKHNTSQRGRTYHPVLNEHRVHYASTMALPSHPFPTVSRENPSATQGGPGKHPTIGSNTAYTGHTTPQREGSDRRARRGVL
ncbi:uncharacterized protein LOC115786557 [Archocentrus centrarchus]|uniref:uncharacterized protein LOC115786557 n=1 Tax=Archocentrus centrarchus TaxID=63155 RepID=UPI0011EA4024|nr:uncharacterized protein LOC115786557 [Archocentrus centrarchus]